MSKSANRRSWARIAVHSAVILGSGIFLFSKLCLFLLPVFWHKLIDKEPYSFSFPKKVGFGIGVITGLVISAIIYGAYSLLSGHLFDAEVMKEQIAEVGLRDPVRYALGAAYWIAVNSVLEEYVWRWFVVKKCEGFLRPAFAVPLSAVLFTVHHAIAVSVYMDILAVVICSTGVFVGGLVWSYMYVRLRSIWPGYVSHAIVDLCILSIGASIIFH